MSNVKFLKNLTHFIIEHFLIRYSLEIGNWILEILLVFGLRSGLGYHSDFYAFTFYYFFKRI